MTPEREKYFTKCNKKELWLRDEIKSYKREIKYCKDALNIGNDYEFWLGTLRFRKMWLQICKNELHRLKGMDRVVVPRDAHSSFTTKEGVNGFVTVGYCVCDKDKEERLNSYDYIYCPKCGRRILWEKG